MKSIIILIAASLAFAACSSTSPSYKVETDAWGRKTLVGRITRPVLERDTSFAWFQTGYARYTPEAPALAALKPAADDLRFVMFIGTWCSDSKAEVPKLFKVFDALSIPDTHIEMFGVDHLKKSGGGEAERYGIKSVPTTIVFSGSKEIGRIVEQPREGIEEDIRLMLEKAR